MAKCTYCDDKKFIEYFSASEGRTLNSPCPECNIETIKIAADSFAKTLHKPEPDFDIYALPVDKDELKLIKIGLFEVSEYLDSPKLRELRQRVNAISNSIKPKLPADSVFNDSRFKQAVIDNALSDWEKR